MNTDPIIEEIRRGRREHAAKFQYVMKAICDDFRRRENELRDRVIAPPCKRPTAIQQQKIETDRQ